MGDIMLEKEKQQLPDELDKEISCPWQWDMQEGKQEKPLTFCKTGCVRKGNPESCIFYPSKKGCWKAWDRHRVLAQ